jgi:hypothetical protein
LGRDFPAPVPSKAKPDEAAVIESLVAFGWVNGGDGGLPRGRRIQPLGEVGEGIIPEAAGNRQGATRGRTHQRLNAGEGQMAQQCSHE